MTAALRRLAPFATRIISHYGASSSSVPGLQAGWRSVKTDANLSKRKASYTQELTDLRNMWRSEYEDAVRKDEEVKQKRLERRAAKLVAAREAEQERRERLRLDSVTQQEKLKHQLETARQQRFEWEALRREMLAKAHEERVADLIEQSRTWITEETLESRILDALDNPEHFHPAVRTQETRTFSKGR